MGKPLSVDLRSRVIAAVDGGLSRRQAAERFGVSVSSAIRWTSLARRTGDVRPRRQGGDNRSARIEGHAPLILQALDDTPDITLAEVQNRLAGHGISVAISTLWRFFRRRRITLKKSRAMPLNKTGPTSSIVAAPGLKGNSISTRRA
jgi:transposase